MVVEEIHSFSNGGVGDIYVGFLSLSPSMDLCDTVSLDSATFMEHKLTT